MSNKLILALPKGRILEEFIPLLEKIDIIPEAEFFDKNSRKLQFSTNNGDIDIIRIRSFDVATFVAYGAASIGIAGKDVIEEFDNEQLYAPVNLGIGKCRMSVAAMKGSVDKDDTKTWSHLKIATKYPKITSEYFAKSGIQAECIKLNGAMELAPNLGLCDRIVDLVSTGKTLEANNLEEIETIMDISSYLIVNRSVYKTRQDIVANLIEKFQKVIGNNG